MALKKEYRKKQITNLYINLRCLKSLPFTRVPFLFPLGSQCHIWQNRNTIFLDGKIFWILNFVIHFDIVYFFYLYIAPILNYKYLYDEFHFLNLFISIIINTLQNTVNLKMQHNYILLMAVLLSYILILSVAIPKWRNASFG